MTDYDKKGMMIKQMVSPNYTESYYVLSNNIEGDDFK